MSLHTTALELGRYIANQAASPEEISEAQAFRASCFRLGCQRDADAWDRDCAHILIRERSSGALVCCYRVSFFEDDALQHSYSAQFYGLDALQRFDGLQMELGRFCSAAGVADPDVLRLAWAVLTQLVDARAVAVIFGCTSFPGTRPDRFADAFAYLDAQAHAPDGVAPKRIALEAVPLDRYRTGPVEKQRALRQMPPLLRSYLNLRGWVSDHAVIDRNMETIHVFTGVEVAAIPTERQQTLRGLHRTAQRPGAMARRIGV